MIKTLLSDDCVEIKIESIKFGSFLFKNDVVLITIIYNDAPEIHISIVQPGISYGYEIRYEYVDRDQIWYIDDTMLHSNGHEVPNKEMSKFNEFRNLITNKLNIILFMKSNNLFNNVFMKSLNE